MKQYPTRIIIPLEKYMRFHDSNRFKCIVIAHIAGTLRVYDDSIQQVLGSSTT